MVRSGMDGLDSPFYYLLPTYSNTLPPPSLALVLLYVRVRSTLTNFELINPSPTNSRSNLSSSTTHHHSLPPSLPSSQSHSLLLTS